MKNKFLILARTSVTACGLAIITAACAGPKETLPLPPEEQASVDRTDPQVRAVLNAWHSLSSKPITMLSPADARNQPNIADAVKKVEMDENLSTAPEPVGGIDNRTVPGPAGDINIRVYSPIGTAPFPALVFFHGGGWVLGNLDRDDAACRALTNKAHCMVISVDYRLAPEHKFPAATEDAYAATQYVISHAKEFKVDPAHVAVGGESAGANIASVVCMMARDRAGVMPVYQLLIYPVCDYAFETQSYQQNQDALPLDRDGMKWFFEQYITTPGEGVNPYISILRGDVSKLPAATVISADIDPLRSEDQAYAEKLRAAGIPVKYMNYDGMTHEFLDMGPVVEKAKLAQRFAAEGLQSAFAQ